MSEITHALAGHAAGLRYEQLPAEAVEKACQLVLDFVGIALRASADVESAKPIRATALAFAGAGDASAVGCEQTLHPAHAALLNGALGHGLDFDDTHRAGTMHAGVAVIPAVLALAEHHRLDGRRVVAALAAGYDVACRLSVAIVPRAHRQRGFHPTGTIGVFGATAAGANLLGLTTEELVNAFGVNVSQAAGSMQFMENGSFSKHLHPGLAGHNAIMALELARHGFLGSASPIEGRHGLLHAYSDGADPSAVLDGLGEHSGLLETAIKPYPTCRYAHTAVDIVCDLFAEHRIDPDEVSAVRIGLCDAAIDIIGEPLEEKRHVKNVVDAQSSMPFIAAVAMRHGGLTWGDLARFDDPALQPLIDRVDVRPDAEANARYPGEQLTSVEIETPRGTFGDRRTSARGEPEEPLSPAEVEAKFDDLAATVLSADDRGELAAMIRDLPALPDLTALGQRLRRATDRSQETAR